MKYALNLLYAIALVISITQQSFSQKTKMMDLLVGTFTEDGMQVYEFNTETGDAKLRSKLIMPGAIYMVMLKDNKHVYTVSEEKNEGFVNAFEFNAESGEFKFINKVSSKGSSPSTITTDENEAYAFVSHFGSGNVTVHPLQKDGKIGEAVQVIQHTGSSVHPQRQDRARAHSTEFTPDHRYLMVGDLGIDKIMLYKLTSNKTEPLAPAPTPFVNEKVGGGTRLVIVHPNKKFIYSIQEITADVTAYSYHDGILTALQTITMVSPETGDVGSAADIKISPDGKFLYASNRGDVNELVVYAIDLKTGKLELRGRQSTLGRMPRYFVIDPTGNYVLVSNMGGSGKRSGAPGSTQSGPPSAEVPNAIVIFKRDKATGLLTDTGKKIDVAKPGFTMFVPM